MPASWVPFTLRRAEPWLLVALAGLALALSAPLGWLVAAVLAMAAVLAAFWSFRRPAPHQAELALRAAVLAATALALQCTASPPPTDALLWWSAAACAAYAFLLPPAWLAGALLLTLEQLLPGPAAQPDFDLVGAAVLVVPAVLASIAGQLLRNRAGRCDPAMLDAATGLFNRNGLRFFGDDLLDGCRRRGRPVAMVLFDCADLAEVRAVYGSRTARALFRRLLERLDAVAGTRGIVARTGGVEFAVLLPGLGREGAIQAVRRALGSPSRIEYDVRDSEIVLVPDFAVDATGPEAADCGELYERLHARLARVRADEARRQRRMRRSRERPGGSSLAGLDAGTSTDPMPLPAGA